MPVHRHSAGAAEWRETFSYIGKALGEFGPNAGLDAARPPIFERRLHKLLPRKEYRSAAVPVDIGVAASSRPRQFVMT